MLTDAWMVKLVRLANSARLCGQLVFFSSRARQVGGKADASSKVQHRERRARQAASDQSLETVVQASRPSSGSCEEQVSLEAAPLDQDIGVGLLTWRQRASMMSGLNMFAEEVGWRIMKRAERQCYSD